MSELINPNPVVYDVSSEKIDFHRLEAELVEDIVSSEEGTPVVARDAVDAEEVFEHIRRLNDPEHPLTLEQLKVVACDQISVDDDASLVDLHFTPTIPHCSMATLIGLCLRVKLSRSLPSRFKIDIAVTPGSHASEKEVNRQLNDKERVAAALENNSLLSVIHKCIGHTCQPSQLPSNLSQLSSLSSKELLESVLATLRE